MRKISNRIYISSSKALTGGHLHKDSKSRNQYFYRLLPQRSSSCRALNLDRLAMHTPSVLGPPHSRFDCGSIAQNKYNTVGLFTVELFKSKMFSIGFGLFKDCVKNIGSGFPRNGFQAARYAQELIFSPSCCGGIIFKCWLSSGCSIQLGPVPRSLILRWNIYPFVCCGCIAGLPRIECCQLLAALCRVVPLSPGLLCLPWV